MRLDSFSLYFDVVFKNPFVCLVLVINQHLIHRISTLAGTRRDMDLHSVWIIIVILFKYWNAQVEADNTDSSPVVTDKTRVWFKPDNVAATKQVTSTSIPEMTTLEATTADETQITRGADVIFVLCIATSCGLMLVLLTLLSFVAIHYYRDKQDRNSMHLLNETINLADQSCVENLRSVDLESDGSELPNVFIDADMNGDVYYSKRNSAGHLKQSMIAKRGFRCSKSFFGEVQYPSLVHPSDIGLGRRRPVRPHSRSSNRRRPNHLLPIPEITAEISEDQTRVREPEPENCITCLNKENSSVLSNPLMKSSSSKENELVEWKLDFVKYLLQDFTEEVQHLKKMSNGNTVAFLNSNSSASGSASIHSLNSRYVFGNFSAHSSSFKDEEDSLELHNLDSHIKSNRTHLSDTVQLSPTNPEENGFHPSVKNNKDLPLQIFKNRVHQIEMVERHPNDYISDEDHDTFSIHFEDDSNDDEMETGRGAENLCTTDDSYYHNKIATLEVSNQLIPRANSQNLSYNPNQNETLNPSDDIGKQDIYFYVHGCKNIGLPLGRYNKYHAGYSTVGHIKHKPKAQDSLQDSKNQKKKCRSCPNSPLQGSRSEHMDVPMVTYIRTHPSLNVAVQSYTSTTGLGGNFDLSKHFNNDWEMRTLF